MSNSIIPREYYPYMTIICKIKQQRLVGTYFEVQVTPNDPAAERIPPIVVKAERSPPEVRASPEDPDYLYQLFTSYRAARRMYKSTVKKAVDIRNKLMRKYRRRRYVVTLVQKRI